MATTSDEEACRLLDGLLRNGVEAFLLVASAALERPADRQLQALLSRTLVDLDRLVRLRQGLCR